jgi:hypothetical protein
MYVDLMLGVTRRYSLTLFSLWGTKWFIKEKSHEWNGPKRPTCSEQSQLGSGILHYTSTRV